MNAEDPVVCPICSEKINPRFINAHIDSGCKKETSGFFEAPSATAPAQFNRTPQTASFSNFFQNVSTPGPGPAQNEHGPQTRQIASTQHLGQKPSQTNPPTSEDDLGSQPTRIPREDEVPIIRKATVLPSSSAPLTGLKRSNDDANGEDTHTRFPLTSPNPPSKRTKSTIAKNPLDKAAPLADRMRPRTLSEVYGQPLVAPGGLLHSLVTTSSSIPSMILWGGPGTGKTTIARLIARTANTRFVEINSTSTGVGECKKLFQEARNELGLTGRKTIIFCDEIHRFTKAQQDVFLAPVEAGVITLIGATTENPSFKVINALLSRCQTFTLKPLKEEDIARILQRALTIELEDEQGVLRATSCFRTIPRW